MEALLKIRNLSIQIEAESRLKQFLSSVEDISFDIFPGEILGLAGESGSGKSLSALSVVGLLGEGKKVANGSIIFRGRDMLALGEKEMQAIRGKEISFIFQEPSSSLNPLLRIGSQITETLHIHGEKDKKLARLRAIELLRRMKLPEPEKLMKAFPHQLSGGMCQRVMLALAIICRPCLLIADEPSTALDYNTQEQILSLLKEINSDYGTSILFISHDLAVIKDLCSRVLVMYSGRILEEGNTEEIFSRPAHEYTRGLLGCIPGKAKKGEALLSIPGRIPSLEEGRGQGCPFHPRCAKALARCKSEFPPEREISSTHKTYCILGK